MNQPDRYSRFVLPSGVPHAVEYKPDTKMRAAGTFTIWLEDHTIGNLVRQQLHSNPEVGRSHAGCAGTQGSMSPFAARPAQLAEQLDVGRRLLHDPHAISFLNAML